jgi:hypothetical protein
MLMLPEDVECVRRIIGDYARQEDGAELQSEDSALSRGRDRSAERQRGNDSNLLIVFYVQIMPDDFVMQLHRF